MEEKLIKKNLIVICLILVFGCLLFSSDKPFCPQIANYTMDVQLDTQEHLITCKEYLEWTNSSEETVDELRFHIYWNAFQNNMSDFLVEGTQRWKRIYSRFTKEDWGYCRIQSIKIAENSFFKPADLTSTLKFIQPDDQNEHDQTVCSVDLPQPVQPGQTIRLRIDFESKIPKPIHRTGVYKDYYFIAQWFPKIGVYYEGQWNCHQFHATTNFFADYGTYDVRITLPSSFVVGGCGEHLEKIDNGDGTTTHHFYQHSIHDFSWTASPHFLVFKEDYEFSSGKTTQITLLLQPYHRHLKDRYMKAVKNSLKYCSEWYGDYPYSTITCVDPAYNSNSGGMEYPTLFTAGTSFLTKKGIPSPEGVTIHEFGHEYFYGLIGTNEFENAWMDEGFTSFLDSEVYYTAYGDPLYSERYFGYPVVFEDVNIPIEASGISSHRRTSNMDIMQRFTWHFMNSRSYGANSYSKGELMLRTLKRYMGEKLFSKMIKAYSQRHWFKHPRPEDFFAVVKEFAGKDMRWFFDQCVYGSGKLDYSIGKISSQKERKPRGWFNNQYKSGQSKSANERMYKSEVIVRRLGEVRIPVEVLVVFEDGHKVKEKWNGQYRWKKFSYTGNTRIKKAIVDPEFKLVLDVNRTNNSQTLSPNPLAPYKWTSNWMIWLQHALEIFTLFSG